MIKSYKPGHKSVLLCLWKVYWSSGTVFAWIILTLFEAALRPHVQNTSKGSKELITDLNPQYHIDFTDKEN